MNKREAIKIAWNAADDKVEKYLQSDYLTFRYALGVRVGISIANTILNNNWNEKELKEYLEKAINI